MTSPTRPEANGWLARNRAHVFAIVWIAAVTLILIVGALVTLP